MYVSLFTAAPAASFRTLTLTEAAGEKILAVHNEFPPISHNTHSYKRIPSLLIPFLAVLPALSFSWSGTVGNPQPISPQKP